MTERSRYLILLASCAYIVRLLFFYAFLDPNPVRTAYDCGHYHTVAIRLATGQGFTQSDGVPYFYRLPGYPFFLAACYKCVGLSPRAALHVQLVLASMIPVLVYLLAWAVFRQRWVALVSAAVTVVHPGFLIMSGLLMAETLFVIVWLLFLIAFVRWRWACAGFLLGCASLVRPVGILGLIITVFMIGKRFKGSVYFVVSYLVPITPWLARNCLITGGLFLSTLAAPHLLNHGATRVIMQANNMSHAQAHAYVQNDINNELALHTDQHPEYAYLSAGQSVAQRIMLSHPWETIKLCCTNMVKTLCSLYSSELFVVDSAGQLPSYEGRSICDVFKRFLFPNLNNQLIIFVVYAELLLNMLIMFGFAWWCVACVYCRRYNFITLTLFAYAALFVITSCVCGFARLRLPSEPIFIMLAVQQFYLLCHKKELEG